MKIKILDDNNIKYQFKKSKSPYIRLSVKEDILFIHTNPYFSQNQIEEIINKHYNWIIKHIKKPFVRYYVNLEPYLYLGKTYYLQIIYSRHENIYLKDDYIVIYSSSSDPNYLEKQLYKWKYNQAELVFNELLHQVFSIMEKDLPIYPKLLIKKFKSRWGVCYLKKQTIALNITLIHADIDVIKYVIIHELSHLVYPNHQKSFHDLVNKYCDEKILRKQLKNLSINYE